MSISVVGVGIATADGCVALVQVVGIADTLWRASDTAEKALWQWASNRPCKRCNISRRDDGEDGKESTKVSSHAICIVETCSGCCDGWNAGSWKISVISSCIKAGTRATNLSSELEVFFFNGRESQNSHHSCRVSCKRLHRLSTRIALLH